MITVAVSGHRPERLGDISLFSECFKNFLIDNEIYRVYVGMCEGADIVAAMVAKENDVPYVACRPWLTHKSGDVDAYNQTLIDAQEIHHIEMAIRFPRNDVYHKRNRYMVDNADVLFAAWDGHARGGTYETKNYAIQKGKRVYHFNVVDPSISRWL